MKTCPYCGAQYPDEATVCTTDGQSLTPPPQVRKHLTGMWRGAYGYENEKLSGGQAVAFTLKLQQGWLGHFTVTVAEALSRRGFQVAS